MSPSFPCLSAGDKRPDPHQAQFPPVAHELPVARVSRVGAAERGQDDQRTAQGSPGKPAEVVPQRPSVRPSLLPGL